MEEPNVKRYMDDTNSSLVSVIIAFLNEERFLAQAVESVLQQDYTHYEILLVDDGSTDNSSAIARGYAARYSGKIRYCEHEGHRNKGLSASRNLGISQAKGSYITFLDADDIWLPPYLSNQVRIVQEQGVGIVCEATEYWYNWNDADKENAIVPIGAKQDTLYMPPQLMLELYPLGGGAAPCVCGVIVKKELLLKHGCFDEAFTGMYEDQVFLSKFYLHEPVYFSSACNNRYRQRPDSLVGSSHGHYHKVRKFFLEWLQRYLEQQGYKDARVWGLLRKAQFPYRRPWLFYVSQKAPRQLVKGLKKAVPPTLKQYVKALLVAARQA